MAGPVFEDDVAEWTTTSGTTRPYVLSGPIPGHVAARQRVENNNWGFWSIKEPGGPRYEWIRGRLVNNTIVVISIIRSSDSGSAISWPETNRRIIRLEGSPAAYITDLQDEMFWSHVDIGINPDMGNLADQVTNTIDMGDWNILGIDDTSTDLVKRIDLGEGI